MYINLFFLNGLQGVAGLFRRVRITQKRQYLLTGLLKELGWRYTACADVIHCVRAV